METEKHFTEKQIKAARDAFCTTMWMLTGSTTIGCHLGAIEAALEAARKTAE